MTYSFPAAKFATTNTIPRQLLHIASEFWEVFKVLCFGPIYAATLAPPGYCWKIRFVEELIDLYHSLETLFRIIERKWQWGMAAHFEAVHKKNAQRGYYDEH